MTERRAHIPSLDGLRGFAVLLVMIQHFIRSGPSTPGATLVRLIAASGWVGVDLFFVLSGFLITGILIDARRQGLLALRPFYARRALRILPPFVGLMSALLTVSLIMPSIDPQAARSFIDHQWWQWTFLTNIRIVNSGDWSAFPYTNHLWSLAIEEQFYLIWPIVVLTTGLRTVTTVAALSVFGALACRLYLLVVTGAPLAALVLLPARVDELSFGALIALAVRHDGMRTLLARVTARIGRGVLPPLLFLGISFVVTALTVSQQATISIAYGLGLTAVGLSAAFLLASLVVPLEGYGGESTSRRWFSHSWLRRTGTYSYTVYLVHYPLIAIAHRLTERERFTNHIALDFFLALVVGGISFGIAAASWRFLESPLLTLRRKFPYADVRRIRAPAL